MTPVLQYFKILNNGAFGALNVKHAYAEHISYPLIFYIHPCP